MLHGGQLLSHRHKHVYEHLPISGRMQEEGRFVVQARQKHARRGRVGARVHLHRPARRMHDMLRRQGAASNRLRDAHAAGIRRFGVRGHAPGGGIRCWHHSRRDITGGSSKMRIRQGPALGKVV